MSFSQAKFHYIKPFTKKELEAYEPPKRDWKKLDASHYKQGLMVVTFLADVVKEGHTDIEYAGRGRPQEYTDGFITGLQTMSFVLNQGYRKIIGTVAGLAEMAGRHIVLPHYTMLSKRDVAFDSDHVQRIAKSGKVLAIDSTGLRLDRRGLHNENKWGSPDEKVKRKFNKLHIVIDVATQQIVAHQLTTDEVGDITVYREMDALGVFDDKTTIGDGAYDVLDFYDKAKARGGKHIAPPDWNSVEHKELGYNHPRNVAVRAKDRLELPEWKRKVGYHKRSLVETANHVYKSAFGESMRCKNSITQQREVALKINIYNLFKDC